MSFTRRSFLALSTLVSLSASAYALDPEAYAKASLTLDTNNVPSGVTATMTQTVTQYPYGPPSYYNFTKSGGTTSAVLETANKKQNSHAESIVKLTLENTSSSVANLNITLAMRALAEGQGGGKAVASASMGGHACPATFTSTGGTGGGAIQNATFTITGPLDPGEIVIYSGGNFIKTEVPQIGDIIGGPGGGGN